MKVLVLNAGSATLKFQLIEVDGDGDPTDPRDGRDRLARGLVDRFGECAEISLEAGARSFRTTSPVENHAAALAYIIRWLTFPDASGPAIASVDEIEAVGHRVVHGGERFRRSVPIDAAVRQAIAELADLAPLHNPHNLACIEAATALLGDTVVQVAVFDTAFHATLADHAFLYALPWELYERSRIRRYGFHGTSHRYVAERYHAIMVGGHDGSRLVSLHLGNGASACAIANGESIDTSMGFTPLEGLVMGTRSGDIDPALIEYLAREEGLGLERIHAMLNRESGLLGISGRSHDMRDLLEDATISPDGRSALAIRMFAWRARKYVGAYLAALGGADAIVFTGGIGENAPAVRAMICEGLQWAGLTIEPARNEATVGRVEGRISGDASTLAAWVIPTDEERLIARDAARLARGT